MPGARPRRRRRLRNLLLLTAALTGLLAPALAGPATAYQDPFPERHTIRIAGGWLDVSIGGYFDGLVFPTPGQGTHATSNLWTKSTESYTGPGGRKYHTYRNIKNNECFSHEGDVLLTEPCVWADNGQWWAVETVTVPCSPAPCWHMSAQLFAPWDQPTRVLTDVNAFPTLTAKQGTIGTPAQRVGVLHIPAPPW